jgi:hypothetical protein
MGDDGGYSINDLPKVSRIISSEPISKANALDVMIRFLNANNPSDASDPAEDTDAPNERYGALYSSNLYHCWDDLFRVAETLASRPPGVPLDADPQQVALRNLRLGVTFQTGGEMQDSKNTETSQFRENTLVVEKASHDGSPRKRSKKEKSEKKEKKRKRER